MHVEAWLHRAARTRPQAPALGAINYSALHDLASRAATALAGRGARPGERVAIALGAGEDFVVALHACLLLGAPAVPVDLRLPDPPTGGAAIVIDEPLTLDGEPLAGTPRHDLEAPAIVVHTSGTTAAPRPIELTFGNWLWSALGSGVALGARPDDRWLCTLPLSHVGGLSILVRSAIYASTAIVHERWDTQRAVAEIAGGATLVSVVPTTLRRLLDDGDLHNAPALRCALLGGAPCPPDLLRQAAEAGVPVAQTYGLTEACSQVTTAAPGDLRPDAGPPLFCTTVTIGAAGEILVDGLTVAGGGHTTLRTGDLGALDDEGRLTVTGRLADTIVTGGENVAPTAVEAVLLEHPAVADAAVHGRADERWGEAVVASIVLRPGAQLDEPALRAHCAATLAPYAVPKTFTVVGALPRTPSGKLLRRELR
jgi:O-succinylbenzoic acid--CoA ligase